MKTLSLLLFMIFCSCSSDLISDSNTMDAPLVSTSDVARGAGDLPENSNNPYDYAGKITNNIVEAYYSSTGVAVGVSAVQSRIMTIANSNLEFTGKKGSNYHEVDTLWVKELISNPGAALADALSKSSLTPAARTEYTTFVSDYIVLMNDEDDYAVIHESICAYESLIAISSTLTANDKKVILTCTSIARYVAKPPKKRPKKNTDPDWTIFVGWLVGGLSGTGHDTAEGIATALVTGIAQN